MRKPYFHREPLLRRSDISLARELHGAAAARDALLEAREARKMLDLILDTSAMRYRELYGFTHPDARRVFRADAGRGVEIVFFGVPPAWRLPLRAYHAGMFFKNGVPAGYVEVLSLFERAEVGFNLYYTFREGESAWLYARLLRLFRQVLGVTLLLGGPLPDRPAKTTKRWIRARSGSTASWVSVRWIRRRRGWSTAKKSRMRRTPGLSQLAAHA